MKQSWFTRFAKRVSRAAGRPAAFIIALSVVVTWAVMGPFAHFTDTWQLIINTGTTIATFLMVFLIQNTQNRDAEAIHAKLDELIRANKRARNAMLDLEQLDDKQLEAVLAEYEHLAERARATHAERANPPRRRRSPA